MDGVALQPVPPADRLFVNLSLGSATVSVECVGRDPAHPGAAETVTIAESCVRQAVASRLSGALVLALTSEAGEVELVLPAGSEAPPAYALIAGKIAGFLP